MAGGRMTTEAPTQRVRLSSGVGKDVDDAPAERPFEIAVRVEPKRLEPRPVRLLARTRE